MNLALTHKPDIEIHSRRSVRTPFGLDSDLQNQFLPRPGFQERLFLLNRYSRILRVCILGCLALCLTNRAIAAGSAELKIVGTRSSYEVYNILSTEYSRWITTSFSADYRPIGNEKAIEQIANRTADLAIVDVAVSEGELSKQKLLQFPGMTTAIVAVANLPGVKNNQLKLSGVILAGIMSGTIAKWNAPEIRAINPKLTLPGLAIKPVVRDEMAGATQVITSYLAGESPEFEKRVGAARAAHWPAEMQRARDAEAAADLVSATPGAISYIETGTGNRKGLNFVALKHANGNVLYADIAFLGNGTLGSRAPGVRLVVASPDFATDPGAG